MEEQHRCQAVALHCIDFRIQKSLNTFLETKFPRGYDRIAVTGGVKHLLSDSPSDNFVLEQLEISNRLHSPKKIFLIQHEDCGAYGGSKQWSDFQVETRFHQEELSKTKQLLKSSFPDIAMEKYLIRISGELIPLE